MVLKLPLFPVVRVIAFAQGAPVVPPPLNVAVTDRAAVMVRVQVVAVPEHEPPQPPNVKPLAGVAVSVTEVPDEYVAEQVEPQLMPPVLEVIVPLPVPDFATVRP